MINSDDERITAKNLATVTVLAAEEARLAEAGTKALVVNGDEEERLVRSLKPLSQGWFYYHLGNIHVTDPAIQAAIEICTYLGVVNIAAPAHVANVVFLHSWMAYPASHTTFYILEALSGEFSEERETIKTVAGILRRTMGFA
jgi:hypothetical protein